MLDFNREIGNSDTKEAAKDTTAAKAYASFLVELSEKLPSTVLPSVYLVIELLERDVSCTFSKHLG